MLNKNLISTALTLFIISCGGGSGTESKVASIDHKQQEQTIMIVEANPGEHCKAKIEESSLVSSELLNPSQDSTKFAEAGNAEEIKQLDINKMPYCDQETLNAVKRLTSEEVLTANAGCLVLAGTYVGVGVMAHWIILEPIFKVAREAANSGVCG